MSPIADKENALFAVQVDLRACFGKLEPGQYSIRVVLPEQAYEIEGLPGFKNKDLESAALTVSGGKVESTLKKWQAGAYPLIVRDGADPSVGTLTNKLTLPIIISLLQPAVEGKPLGVSLARQRWHPKYEGYSVEDAEAVDPKGPTYRLKPGESVKMTLPDKNSHGDGAFYFVLDVGHVVRLST